MKKIAVIAFLAFISTTLFAKVKLPGVLADNMVLQQQSQVKLWGEAKPGSIVNIKPSWAKRSYSTTTGKDGKWIQQITTPVAGGPYEITFNDGEKTTLKNFLIGEVWFCSGQSNMEMPVQGFDRQPVNNIQDILIKAKKEVPIRFCNIPRITAKTPQSDCETRWEEHTPEGVARASATAYFFAKYLNEVLDVPIGLIISNWGGSKVEPWMSIEALTPFKDEVDISHLTNDKPVGPKQVLPGVLYNAMISPVINYTIKGMIWYQGESNRGQEELYGRLMPAFVKDLRQKWGLGDFPFYYVQIAPFQYDGVDITSSSKLREVQLRNMNEIPNSGMAVTLDIGEKTKIHPAEKEKVGNRLAYWALAKTYNKNNFGYSGPIYKSIEIKGNKIYVNFSNAPKGVAPLETERPDFEIAGEDKIFYPAKAVIEAKSGRLGVSSPQVPNPVAVRYAYKNFVVGSLFDVYGLPASSFRSDNWEIK